MTNLVGQDIGRYHIVQQLGQGGMAIVYKAFDTRLERDVALKIIRQDAIRSDYLEQTLKRFEREAKSLAQLDHPHIVKIHDYGEHNGAPYLVMQYISGGTLHPTHGLPLAYQEAARLMAPIARALEYAHHRNIIHRDVKPANILITDSGEPVLSDFGIAKILQTEPSANLTAAGVGIGTPEYMAPEQGMAVSVDHRADIYSLGVVFYELVTGRHPYRADTPIAVLLKHMTEPLPRPKQFVPSLPDQVEQIIFKSMAKKPDDRYQEMGTFAAALESLKIHDVKASEIHSQKTPGHSFIPPVVSSQPVVSGAVSRIPGQTSAKPASGLFSPVLPVSQLVEQPALPVSSAVIQGQIPRAQPAAQPAKKKTGWTLWAGLGALAVGVFLCFIIMIGIRGLFPPTQPGTAVPVKTVTGKQTGQAIPGPTILSSDNALAARKGGSVRWLDTLSVESYSEDERNQLDKPIIYTIALERTELLLWGTGWCSINKETLYNNINQIKYQFTINDTEVNLEKNSNTFMENRQSDSSPCNYVYILLDQWKKGTHRLVIRTILDKKVNDGWKTYNSGVMIHEYRVTVKE